MFRFRFNICRFLIVFLLWFRSLYCFFNRSSCWSRSSRLCWHCSCFRSCSRCWGRFWSWCYCRYSSWTGCYIYIFRFITLFTFGFLCCCASRNQESAQQYRNYLLHSIVPFYASWNSGQSRMSSLKKWPLFHWRLSFETSTQLCLSIPYSS